VALDAVDPVDTLDEKDIPKPSVVEVFVVQVVRPEGPALLCGSQPAKSVF